MPLDTATLAPILSPAAGPTLAERVTLGMALKAQRLSSGLSLEQVAATTRVRRAYLEAIEQSRWDQLPTGPFAAGYARLYAQAVGLSGDKAAAALRAETPGVDAALPPPVGLMHQDRGRLGPMVAGLVAIVVAGVFLWNVAQRSTAPVDDPATPPPVEAAWIGGSEPGGVIRLSAPTAAPADQNAPVPYETPGLVAAMTPAQPVATPVVQTTVTPPSAAPSEPVGAAFNPRAAVHGAAPQDSRLTVQARRAASVVVRRADGAILFARQLSAGEAYRAPAELGLVVDVSDPTAFDLYRDGEFQGQLTEQQNRVDRFLG